MQADGHEANSRFLPFCECALETCLQTPPDKKNPVHKIQVEESVPHNTIQLT
jgi:hypothetical protein